MPRVDDYNQARDLARKQLLQGNPELVARFSGATINGDKESGSDPLLRLLESQNCRDVG